MTDLNKTRTFKFTLKLKSENAPEFKEGLGKGVLSTREVTMTSDSDIQTALGVNEAKQELIDDIIEVLVEELN
jgi:hypothetical protein